MTMTFDYELSPEHDELRRTVERFARQEVAPVIGEYYERTSSRIRSSRRWRSSGSSGCRSPRSTAA